MRRPDLLRRRVGRAFRAYCASPCGTHPSCQRICQNKGRQTDVADDVTCGILPTAQAAFGAPPIPLHCSDYRVPRGSRFSRTPSSSPSMEMIALLMSISQRPRDYLDVVGLLGADRVPQRVPELAGPHAERMQDAYAVLAIVGSLCRLAVHSTPRVFSGIVSCRTTDQRSRTEEPVADRHRLRDW